MNALEVAGLKKNYAGFSLNVSFALEEGKITGFIGRNGAGKTTTIKSLLGFVHPDAGDIRFFSMPFAENEMKIKSRLGVVLGGVNYYPQKRLGTVAAVTSRFYPEWDDSLYRKYMQLFSLDESKRISELSAGMKVNFRSPSRSLIRRICLSSTSRRAGSTPSRAMRFLISSSAFRRTRARPFSARPISRATSTAAPIT